MAKRTSQIMKRVNLTLVFVWILMGIPTVLWWKESVLWVAIMSLYANIVGHWSAFQGSRAEVQAEKNGDST